MIVGVLSAASTVRVRPVSDGMSGELTGDVMANQFLSRVSGVERDLCDVTVLGASDRLTDAARGSGGGDRGPAGTDGDRVAGGDGPAGDDLHNAAAGHPGDLPGGGVPRGHP